MEAGLRHHDAAAALAAGASATAWATGVAAYFKRIPLACLAGDVSCPAPPGPPPFPEWLHRHTLARLAQLHLCPSERAAQSLRRLLETDGLPEAAAEIRVVGDPTDESLARSLGNPPGVAEDPTVAGLRPEAPRVLVFMRRREHHANALRPICEALNALSLRFPTHEFIVVHSLQSFICDAFMALAAPRPNLRGISPLPHPAFVRELCRARLVVTDSAGAAREAALLGRPLAIAGAYSLSPSLPEVPGVDYVVAPMRQQLLETCIAERLAAPAPPPAPSRLDAPPVGKMAAEEIVSWWLRRAGNGPSPPAAAGGSRR
jgi:UDP-N-acetylglucosamine 2-epimerase (non-hydrolysing)